MVSRQGGVGVMSRKHDVVRLRARLGLSQEKFAIKLGVSTSIVSKWEKGLNKPRGLSLRAIDRLTRQLRRRVSKR